MPTLPRFGFAVRYVSDIEAAKRFYSEVLDLRIERQHPTFVQFENFAIASDDAMTSAREPELYWLVDDAEIAFREMSRHAEVTLPLSQKPFGKVFGIQDPSGQPCYMLELARDRPSQMVK